VDDADVAVAQHIFAIRPAKNIDGEAGNVIDTHGLAAGDFRELEL
jgi:hypothetical protein